YEEARNGDGHVMDMERERAADCPQNCNERRCRKYGRCHSSREIDRRLRRYSHVVGYATFRVLVGAAHEIELIMAAVFEPAIGEKGFEPCWPSPPHTHASATAAPRWPAHLRASSPSP